MPPKGVGFPDPLSGTLNLEAEQDSRFSLYVAFEAMWFHLKRSCSVRKRPSFWCVELVTFLVAEGGTTMSYIKHSLGESEHLLYRARFPWFYHVTGWGVLLALVAGGIAGYGAGYGALAATLGLTGVVLFLAIMVPIWTTEIGVTNQRFIYKRGLLWRSTQELQLRAIEERLWLKLSSHSITVRWISWSASVGWGWIRPVLDLTGPILRSARQSSWLEARSEQASWTSAAMARAFASSRAWKSSRPRMLPVALKRLRWYQPSPFSRPMLRMKPGGAERWEKRLAPSWTASPAWPLADLTQRSAEGRSSWDCRGMSAASRLSHSE